LNLKLIQVLRKKTHIGSNCVVLTESCLLVISSVQLICLLTHMKNGTGSPGHRVTGSPGRWLKKGDPVPSLVRCCVAVRHGS